VDILDRDVHRERRRILWQRAYLAALDKLILQWPRDLPLCTVGANSVAGQAVRDLDEWENAENGEAPHQTPPTGDPSGPEGDDSEAQYLGG
jgi:hypothetical protein